MKVKNLKLKNFRNYKELSIDFEKGVNYLQGTNGAGKTSLVESIGLLPLCKSIRGSDEVDIINFNQDFALVEAIIEKEDYEKIRIVISRKGKAIKLNDYDVKKVSEIAGIVKVVSFLPKDTELFKEVPLKRRKFIDQSISMIDKEYLKVLGEYNHYLQEIRNLLRGFEVDKVLLSVLVKELVKRGMYLQKERKKFIYLINEELKSVCGYLDDNESEMNLIYIPMVDIDEVEKYEEFVYKKITDSMEYRNSSRISINGIHGDDIRFDYNKKDLGTYGSQGQNRLAVISLKIALFEMIKNKFNDEPIVILDDVLSELDLEHQNKLINLLSRIEQVFITGTSIQIKDNKKYKLYTVEDNTVRRIV